MPGAFLLSDDTGMSTITSTDKGQNANFTAASQLENRATDAEEQGKLKSAVDGSNGAAQMAAHSFEANRVANDAGH
jgi:hypothetical protein